MLGYLSLLISTRRENSTKVSSPHIITLGKEPEPAKKISPNVFSVDIWFFKSFIPRVCSICLINQLYSRAFQQTDTKTSICLIATLLSISFSSLLGSPLILTILSCKHTSEERLHLLGSNFSPPNIKNITLYFKWRDFCGFFLKSCLLCKLVVTVKK